MAYTALTFVSGEVLTAVKMSLLAANDASFHDGTGIGDATIKASALAVTTLFSGYNDSDEIAFVDSPGNYTYLKIYAEESGGRKIYNEVYAPKVGDRITIAAPVIGNNGAKDAFIRGGIYVLTATGMTRETKGMLVISTTGVASVTIASATRITRVIGYR